MAMCGRHRGHPRPAVALPLLRLVSRAACLRSEPGASWVTGSSPGRTSAGGPHAQQTPGQGPAFRGAGPASLSCSGDALFSLLGTGEEIYTWVFKAKRPKSRD